jgi:hypothetical protein
MRLAEGRRPLLPRRIQLGRVLDGLGIVVRRVPFVAAHGAPVLHGHTD